MPGDPHGLLTSRCPPVDEDRNRSHGHEKLLVEDSMDEEEM